MEYKEIAENLWQLLDNIDTASDVFKPSTPESYKLFYEYTMKMCVERGKYMQSLDGYTLEKTI